MLQRGFFTSWIVFLASSLWSRFVLDRLTLFNLTRRTQISFLTDVRHSQFNPKLNQTSNGTLLKTQHTHNTHTVVCFLKRERGQRMDRKGYLDGGVGLPVLLTGRPRQTAMRRTLTAISEPEPPLEETERDVLSDRDWKNQDQLRGPCATGSLWVVGRLFLTSGIQCVCCGV